ncbi:MAG: FMN-binding protein [Spirochaetes bacterium]|nr:FMN-binding protein [Spirochaetota bacterium]MBU1081418.1 FMN-binding protein [Spirochaetota bacterium]
MKRLTKSTIIIAGAIVVLYGIGRALPETEEAYPRMRAAAAAFRLEGVKDGVYEGKAFLLPVSVRVKATVAGGRISSIELLKHFNGQGKPAEAILDEVIARQSLGVDVVAGATHSSLTILSAVEDALEKGKRR